MAREKGIAETQSRLVWIDSLPNAAIHRYTRLAHPRAAVPAADYSTCHFAVRLFDLFAPHLASLVKHYVNVRLLHTMLNF